MDSKRYKVMPRDDMPRFVAFNCPLFNCNASNLPPPMKRIALPYQVLPNGRIIASQLLKIEIIWSAMESIVDPSHQVFLRRFVLDAVQSPHVLAGQLVPMSGDTNTGSWDYLSTPLLNPSVIGCYDRSSAIYSGATTTSSGMGGMSQNEEHYFGCSGDYPVVPSGAVHCYGFWVAASATIGPPSSAIAVVAGDGNSGFRGFQDVIHQKPEFNYPAGTPSWPPDNQNRQPFVSCRLWYRAVELTPYQHIMIVNKYTNKLPNSGVAEFDKTSPANQSLNPLRGYDGSNPTVWFGS